MIAEQTLWDEIECRINSAELRYGDFASTHEALGVASEEWDELRKAIHENDIEQICHECVDLASVLIRMVRSLHESPAMRNRSVK